MITADDVKLAVSKLKRVKIDGMHVLSSDYFLNAGHDLYVHLALLFTAMIVHGIVPREFLISSILPIPKSKLSGTANSDNYRGIIALSSILGKILDQC